MFLETKQDPKLASEFLSYILDWRFLVSPKPDSDCKKKTRDSDKVVTEALFSSLTIQKIFKNSAHACGTLNIDKK